MYIHLLQWKNKTNEDMSVLVGWGVLLTDEPNNQVLCYIKKKKKKKRVMCIKFEIYGFIAQWHLIACFSNLLTLS
jgi:hypothetical protein